MRWNQFVEVDVLLCGVVLTVVAEDKVSTLVCQVQLYPGRCSGWWSTGTLMNTTVGFSLAVDHYSLPRSWSSYFRSPSRVLLENPILSLSGTFPPRLWDIVDMVIICLLRWGADRSGESSS